MPNPQCPSCGSGDCTVMGLEKEQIRYRCQHCLETFLFNSVLDESWINDDMAEIAYHAYKQDLRRC